MIGALEDTHMKEVLLATIKIANSNMYPASALVKGVRHTLYVFTYIKSLKFICMNLYILNQSFFLADQLATMHIRFGGRCYPLIIRYHATTCIYL